MQPSANEWERPKESPLRPPTERVRRILQFGAFELRMDTGELRKHGIRVRIQAKPLAVLRALLEKPGEVVTREELRAHLWPADTFVDFESGLNTAANRLRLGLGDSADTPRFIETLPRAGYRFIAPVMVVGSAAATPTEAPPPETPPASGKRIHTRTAVYTAAGIVLALLAAAGLFLPYRWLALHTPVFHQLTFQTGWIGTARFVPGGNNVVYTRVTEGHEQLYLVNTDSPESRPLDFQRTRLLAVSSTGELAILMRDPSGFPMDHASLARVPLNGGSPRVIWHGPYDDADFAPNGETLVTVQDGGQVIDYAGRVLYRSSGMVTAMRVSPSGDRIAFLDHPMPDDDAGVVRVVDMKGNVRTLTRHWISASGVAWAPSGREIWFAASDAGIDRALRAVTLDGHDRLISSVPAILRLFDITRNGRVLLSRDDKGMTMAGRLSGDNAERDLTWFDGSHVEDISADGNLVLFTESGAASGAHYWVYLHNRKANSTTRIGDGRALALSPDGTRALAMDPVEGKHLLLIPIGEGAAERISGGGFHYQWAQFFPDGRSLLVAGAFPGQAPALFRQSAGGGKPEPLRAGGTFVDFDFTTLAPDGIHLAGITPAGRCVIIALGSDEVRPCGTDPSLVPSRWAADGVHLYMTSITTAPYQVLFADPATGHAEVVRTLNPQAKNGTQWLAKVAITPDGEHYAYSLHRLISQLFVVDGWK